MKQSDEARAQIAALHHHYRSKNRPEAAQNLTASMRQAIRQITAGQGQPAPGPYPGLAQPDRAWTHAGRYWIRYSTDNPPVILSVFYDESDIPGRL